MIQISILSALDVQENPLKILLDNDKIEEYIDEMKRIKTPASKNRMFFLEIILNDMKMNSSGGD
ncbi:MAG: hypothetical protein IPL53_21595 [Ignavibacteria bacterium]|nr:hypothetical protein [Ignavibacteria bacterium]